MAGKKDCGCGGKANKAAAARARVTVKLAGGTPVKVAASDAAAFMRRHPGSKLVP